jgi:hypothetical protein
MAFEDVCHFLLRRRLAEAIQEIDQGGGSKHGPAVFEVLD